MTDCTPVIILATGIYYVIFNSVQGTLLGSACHQDIILPEFIRKIATPPYWLVGDSFYLNMEKTPNRLEYVSYPFTFKSITIVGGAQPILKGWDKKALTIRV